MNPIPQFITHLMHSAVVENSYVVVTFSLESAESGKLGKVSWQISFVHVKYFFISIACCCLGRTSAHVPLPRGHNMHMQQEQQIIQTGNKSTIHIQGPKKVKKNFK